MMSASADSSDASGAGPVTAMRRAVASSNQQLYLFDVQRLSVIADRVGCEHVEALCGRFGLPLWVTPSMRGGRTFNAAATSLLLAVTGLELLLV